jgi:hypothetical protein
MLSLPCLFPNHTGINTHTHARAKARGQTLVHNRGEANRTEKLRFQAAPNTCVQFVPETVYVSEALRLC